MTSTDFVASYLDAWNHHDPRAVADHLACDGTYYDIPVQQQMARDEFVDHLKEYFTRDSNCYRLIGEVLTGKNSIAFQYRACPPGEEDTDSGWTGAEFITMVGESAGRIEDYYRSPDMGAPADAAAVQPREARLQRYAKSGLDNAGLQAVMRRLNELMDSDQLYLEPDLSLPGLANRLDCSVNHLSQVINAGFGMSFFDYINRYRIKEATRLLRDNGASGSAILDIALSVGFNSTSTFYTAFKKGTGQTPAQFRGGKRGK